MSSCGAGRDERLDMFMPEFIYQMYQARKSHGNKVILDDVTEAVFSKREVVRQAYIIPPQITELGQALPPELGLPRTPLTVETMCQAVLQKALETHPQPEFGRN